jgi:hypothetical protein
MSDTERGMTDAERTRYQAVADQHPGEVGIVGESVNQYGTPVSVLRCADCGTVTSICPPSRPEKWGDGCTLPDCASYDVNRDMDIWFEPLSEHGLIRHKPTGRAS